MLWYSIIPYYSYKVWTPQTGVKSKMQAEEQSIKEHKGQGNFQQDLESGEMKKISTITTSTVVSFTVWL